MNIAGILGLISSVAAILLIFFQINKPVKISLQVFLCILAVVCIVIFAVDYNINGRDKADRDLPQNDSSVVANQPENPEEDDSISDTAGKVEDLDDTEPLSLDDSVEKSEPPEGMQTIAPLVNKTYNVAPIEESPLEIQPNEIIKLSGEIVSEDQVIEYEYTPSISGRYRFEFSDIPHGTDLQLGLYNSGKEEISRYSYLDNGDGITEFLKAGELYYVYVGQYSGLGSYVLNIGQQKELCDISDYTAIADCIQFTDQENDYIYTPKNNGMHRFEFSNVPNGTDLKLTLFNSGWEELESYSYLDNGDGISRSLSAEESYYISVTQYQDIGPYTLNIGPKKEIVHFNDYTAVSDSIQYTDQINSYSFTPELDGTHRFEFSDVPNGTDLKLILLNSGWEELESYVNLDNGDGITRHLTAGETYYIKVAQYKGAGSYTLNIGKKKPAPDISSCAGVADSIQYTDQRNDYLFTAKSDGDYCFTLSNIAAGNSFYLNVYNSGWEKLDSSSNNSVKVSLTKGETYYIQVTQREDSLGEYWLTVEY